MLEVIKLDTFAERDNYSALVSLLNINNPYCLLDYIIVFGGGLEGLMYFKYVTNEKKIIIMPGYLRKVIIGSNISSHFHFSSPYGYTGPFFSNAIKENEIKAFWQHVDDWYKGNNVVSEFIRFNLFNNHLNYTGSVFSTMKNVKGKIIDIEEQWKSFDQKVRKNVNKAIRENLRYKIFYYNIEDKHIEEFYAIYHHTMIRTNAQKSFMYSFRNIHSFISNNPRYCAICTTYDQNIAISSELVLISDDSIFSFLGGTNKLYFAKRPNDFLKFQIINWARNIKKQYYILGGGFGCEDGIFQYKKSFFPNDIVEYFTGRKIMDKQLYNKFLQLRNSERVNEGKNILSNDDTSYFPLYNKVD